MTMLPFPRLVLELFDNSATTFGPTTRKAIIHDAVKVGWSWYSRFPSSCFFSLRQTSTHNSVIVPGLDHVRCWYINDATGYGPELVFAGRVGDPDQSGDDVIWTCWSYMAELALSRTGYTVYYKSATLKSVFEAEWSRDDADGKFKNYGAKVRDHSLLKHIDTGTIERPLGNDGENMLTDPSFGVIDVPRLLLFFDLTEIARANTSQNTTWEITRSVNPEINFWKDKGSHIVRQRLSYPGVVKDFRFVPGVLDIRNDLATIGGTTGDAVEVTAEVTAGTYGTDLFGRRQDTFTIKTLSGYPNLTEDEGRTSAQQKITKRATEEASTLTKALQVDVRHQLFEPFDGWDIEDTIDVEIITGRTNVDATYRIVGVRGILDGDGYTQSMFLTLPVA